MFRYTAGNLQAAALPGWLNRPYRRLHRPHAAAQEHMCDSSSLNDAAQPASR